MFDSILNIFKRKNKNGEERINKDKAKERLHLVLMQDRANVSADFLDLMKQEIIDVIKKYIDVDEEQIDVKLTNKLNGDGTTGAPALYANIPIKSIKKETRINSNNDAKKLEENNTENKDEVEDDNNQSINEEINIEENKQENIVEVVNEEGSEESKEVEVEEENSSEILEKQNEQETEAEAEEDKDVKENTNNKKSGNNKGKKKEKKVKPVKNTKKTTFFENVSVEEENDINKTEE